MISTRGRYAVRVMIDLAENNDGSYVPLKDISKRQEISKKYLEIIIRDMVSAGLVTGVSGKGGGYKLTRKPKEYTVGQILEATEGSLAPVACLEDDADPCPRANQCKTLPLWSEFNVLTKKFFNSKKLSDLL